jgi:RNA polymerase sigma factor (sigma-70 family)
MAASLGHVLSQLQRWTAPRLGELSDTVLLERLVQQRDESAFAALVSRHGAMVLRSCRRILGDVHEAEDAFQAAFLILARKAHTLREPAELPGWLHGVARRVALKARSKTATRAGQTQLSEELPDVHSDPLAQLTARELLTILDEEIARLPLAQRSAVLLCCLEGQTREEAAKLLGCTVGSLKGHLERGRRRLQDRLRHRGIALSAALTVLAVSRGESASPLLLRSTVQAALHGGIGSSAAAVAQSVLQTMFVSKLAGVMTVVLAVALTASITIALVYRGSRADTPEKEKPTAAVAPKDAGAGKPQARTDALGDPLPPRALLRLGTIRFRPGGGVQALAFLPGGHTIVSTGFKGIYFWDAATGKERRRIKTSDEWLRPFALSPDGKVLAMPRGEIIQLWETKTGKELHKLESNAICLAFSHDGRRLACVDQKNTLVLWDWCNRKEERRMVTKQRPINQVGFGPDDRSVYAWDDQNLSAWDATSGKTLPPFSYPDPKKIGFFSTYLDRLVLSPDGKQMARSILKQTVGVYEAGTWREVRQIKAGNVRVEAFTPDGKGLLVANEEGSVLWDVKQGKEIYRIRDVGVPAFSADGRVMALCRMHEDSIRLYDAATGKRLRPLPGHESAVDHVLFSPDGRLIATRGFFDCTVRLWDARNAKGLHVFGGPAAHENNGYSLAFSPDGARLAWGDWGGRIYVVDPRSGRELSRWIVDKKIKTVQSVIFSPDGRSLITASYGVTNGTQPRPLLFQVWDAATGKETARSQSMSGPGFGPPELSPDGKMVLMQENGGWTLREVIRRRALARLQMPDTVQRFWFFAFSPDSRTLAASTLQNARVTLRLWETASGIELLTLPVRDSSDGRVAFSADSRLLALGGSESIRLWDLATRQEVLRLRGHDVTVHSLCFSPNGKTLASGLSNGSVLIWDLSPLPKRRNAAPSPQELEQLWTDLGSRDGPKAYRALWALAASERSIDLLRKHLRSATEAEWADLRRLVDDLDSDDFQTRERTSRELQRRRLEAEPMLEKALANKPSPEARRRIEDVLRRPRPSPPPELLRRLRGMQVLELLGTAQARQLCAKLADGFADAPLTREAAAALQRLARPQSRKR